MPNSRRKHSKASIDDWSVIELIPVQETEEDFRKRISEVQEMIARMMFSAKKRGRPTKQEQEDDYAA